MGESPDIFANRTVTEDQYLIARRHLLEMPWVGLTEYMTQSVKQLKVFLGVTPGSGIRRENVNRKKPSKKEEQRVIDKLIEHNRYDIDLWDLGYVMYLQQQLVIKYAWGIDLNDEKLM